MQQALRFAQAMDVPFVYSSNGDAFLEHDHLATGGTIECERALHDFPSSQDLWQRYKTLSAITPQQDQLITQDYCYVGGGKSPRYYQRVAIQRDVEAIAQGRDRLLMVMARGTGKSYISVTWALL